MPISTANTTSRTQRPARPAALRHYASEALLDRFTRDLAVRVGAAAPEMAGTSAGNGGRHAARPFTVDILRALDADEGDTARDRIPGWLAAAQRTAQRELRAWYARRGIPDPHGVPLDTALPDPGEPQSVEEEAVYWRACPRPNPQTREQQIVEFLKCRASKPYFVDSYLFLKHPERGVIPFRLWRWQGWVVLQWQRHKFNMVLKARQEGLSELAAADSFHDTLFFDSKTTLLLSQGEDEAQVLLGRATTMLDHLPVWLTPETRTFRNPHLLFAASISKLNTTDLEISHEDRAGRAHPSIIESLPATPRTGRSRTASKVVLDEWAHQMWADEIWGAIEPTTDAGGRIIAMSTANGTGNLFYDTWYALSREHSPQEWAVFLSWRRHPERDQAWYDQKAREYHRKNKTPLLHQEYPSEPGEAFIQSGLPVFDYQMINEIEQRMAEEVAARRAEGLADWHEVDGLTIYEEPQAGHEYVIGADVAEGLEHGDYDDAVVIDRATGREVASLHGHWPEALYAAKLDELGYRYHTALLAVERVNHGRAVLLSLLEGTAHERWNPVRVVVGEDGIAKSAPAAVANKRTRYPNLYHYKNELYPGQHEDRRPGWDTNSHTKPLAIETLGRLLRDNGFLPRNLDALEEMRIYSHDGKGGMGAPKGKHDDMVMSRAIAVYLLSLPNMAAHTLAFVRREHEIVRERVGRQRAVSVAGGASAASATAGTTAASATGLAPIARTTSATPAQVAAGLGVKDVAVASA